MVKLEEAPRVGAYLLTKELSRNRFGILYEGQKEGALHKVLLQVISPEIINGENFIVRFELLRSILPTISHPNLLQIEALERHGEIAFVVHEHPSPEETVLLTLAEFDPTATQNRHRTLEALFGGVAQGIQALSEVKNGYYKKGIAHELLVPEKIYITFEQGLIGGAPKPIPKLTGYWESFLFFGDAPIAPLHHRMMAALGEDDQTPHTWEPYLSSATRRGNPTTLNDTLFSLGNLIQESITGHPAAGVFKGLRETDPTLDPLWDQIQEACFSKADDALSNICNSFEEMSSARAQLTPQERKLKTVNVPEGMTLVTFDEKVELGAENGPLCQQPRFRAKITPFLMDLAPVTVDQFTEFQGRYQPSCYSAKGDHPATAVSWTMAKAYLRWRDEQEGLPPGTYRLPTEYEWEAACRGTKGEQYPWGEKANAQRLFCALSKESGTSPVKQHPPGRFGLCDLLGNCWEWTESIFKPHPFSTHVEREYAAMLYVVKGGCWFTPLSECRASLRAAFPPHECKPNVGFRAVRPVEM